MTSIVLWTLAILDLGMLIGAIGVFREVHRLDKEDAQLIPQPVKTSS